jgi:2-polyprenyl-6-methoxyphenol hydroxylase-like FAD-dependent oxidoreductase
MRALIIGAGLGGLCLAHGLRRAGIDTDIYERGAADTPNPATYGIHINTDGARALRDCLPPDNWARFDAAAGQAHDTVRFLDQHLNTLTRNDNPRPTNPSSTAGPSTAPHCVTLCCPA